ncbi:MAG: ABC transporter ATP-binding protein [Verrucomicrobia bacterium]|nr:ABC transporter ATP-binding protein [Verrucomicrobiota bacterium]MBV8278943.1 ABC transporter ATP-binding protein [Verrucomicrobiota bacterium]
MTLPLPNIQEPQPITTPSGQVELRAVTKRYGNGSPVLEDINLSIAESEFVSIIGPSGCGKSTLLKLVAGLTRLSSGSVRVAGVEPVRARKMMSFMFQDATLLPWRTVQRNVELSTELHGVKKAERAAIAGEMLSLVGLSQVAHQFPRQLSGGMKMRVSIARALSTRPKVLLMDEPFAALDELTRDRLNEELLRLRAEGRWTGLFVTHSVAEAVFLSDRIIVLAAQPGRVTYDLPIHFSFPRNAELRLRAEFEEAVIEVSKNLRGVMERRKEGKEP